MTGPPSWTLGLGVGGCRPPNCPTIVTSSRAEPAAFLKGGPRRPCHPPHFARSPRDVQPVDICPEESNIHQRPRSGRRLGLGVEVLSTVAQTQPGVCMHDLQGLRTPGWGKRGVGEGGGRLDLLSLHVRRSGMAAGMMKDCHSARRASGDARGSTRAAYFF